MLLIPARKVHWANRGSTWVLSAKDGPHVGPMNLAIRVCYCVAIHYIDVIMTTVASQITSLTVVYSTVYSDADQRSHQSSASLAFVWGIHRDRWIPRTKGQLRGKCFHLMTSSCSAYLDLAEWPTYHYTLHLACLSFSVSFCQADGAWLCIQLIITLYACCW